MLIDRAEETTMKFRLSGLLALAALVGCLLSSAGAFAQNAYITNFGSATGVGDRHGEQ
jgi:hypothetical protein